MSRNRKQGKPTKQALAKQDGEYTLEELEQRMLFSADVADAFLYDPSQANQPANEALVDENLELVDSASATADARVIELIFIDANTPDAELLVNDLLTRQDDNREFEIITLAADGDGIQQISDVLGERQDVDAIHIISHGNDGQVTLGNTTLSQDNLAAYSEQIQNWSMALDGDADILIYGCNLAATADGQTLIDNIAALTGADIAASDDLTGHASLGGDWELEYVAGSVATEVVVSEFAQAAWQGTLEQTLWLSTDSNVAAPGANGLPGGWTEGQVLDFGGGSLAHGDATAGDFSQVLDFDTFTVDATDPGALHFVSRDMTVGGVNGTFDLKAGDVLVSFLQDETILAAYSDTGMNETYGDQDMLVFRPTSYGNYSSGTFYLLLDEVVADDLKGATLIEQDTTIGGTDVAAGSFLIIAEASGTTSVDLFVPTGVGAGTTTGPITPFIDISNLGIDANRVRGIEVIEAATTVGGQALAKGDILVTLNVDDNVSGVAGNNLLVDANDVFVLTLTSTGPATTAGTAAMFLDGSDVGLDDNPSAENPYALALHNYGQLTVDTTRDVSDGDTSSIDALILSKGADGKISLREAIEAANATPNGDTADVIHFEITDPLVGGVHTIMVGNVADGANGALPDIIDAVVIDGTTDLDFAGNPVIEINGLSSGGADGFSLSGSTSDGSTIRGFIINEFDEGILALDSDNNLFAGNWIGVDSTGTASQANTGFGIQLQDSTGNTIGGSTAADRNVISGNGQSGITLWGAVSGSAIQGNYIGLNALGTDTVGNLDDGIAIGNGASNNLIGGDSTLGQGNVISGNEDAIEIGGAGTDGNLIYGNLIGTDATGIMDKGNTRHGVVIYNGVQNTQIGGIGTGEGNVISGNNDSGIVVDGNGLTSSGNSIVANLIGVQANGTSPLGNTNDGIQVFGSADNVLIGGTASGAGNVIANNALGIIVETGSTGISILGNDIYDNTAEGIDLAAGTSPDGVSTNDGNDGDGGGNLRQNYPVITTAALSGANLTLDGALDTDGVSTQYRLEFFGNANGTQDATNGEGRYYLGETTVTTDGSGDATFSGVLLSGVTLAVGDFVTATATEITTPAQVGIDDQLAYGDTSEFAVNFAMVAAPPRHLNFTISSTPSISEDLAETATFTVSLNGDALLGGDTASVDVTASGSALSGTDYENFITAVTTAAGLATGVSFDGTDTLTFDSSFNSNTGLGDFSFTVDAVDDTEVEGTEAIVATLSNASATNGSASFGTFSDSFTEASNTNITAHTPDAGLSWAEYYNNSSYNEAFIDATTDAIQGGFRASSENDTGQAYEAGPAPTSADQTLSFTLSAIETDDGTKPVGLFGRSTADNSFYYLKILPNAHPTDDSISLWKMDGGATLLTSIDATIAAGDTFTLELTDAAKKVYHNGTEVLSSVNNDLTAAGTWGFFIGNFNGVGGHYRDSWNIDNFIADDGSSTVSATTDITETDVNNPPTVSATPTNPTYTEGDAPVDLFNTVSVSTVEGGQTIEQIVLTVTNITDGSNEILTIDGSTVFLTNGTNDTTGSGYDYIVDVVGSTATITIDTVGASEVDAQNLIDGFSYQNTSQNPTQASRVLTITGLTDSGGATDTSNPGIATTIAVLALNDVPVVTTSGGSTGYSEQNPAVVIDASLTLVDPDGFDGTDPASQYVGVVQITGNYQADDILDFVDTTKIQGNLVGNTLTLSVIGGQTATVAEFEAALQSVTFYNGSDTPSELDRTISFSFDDGVDSSNVATMTIAVTAVNDAPTDLQVVTSTEGGTNINNDSGNDVYFVADDGGGLLGGLTKITVESTFSVTTPATDNTTLLSYADGGNDEELGLFLKNDGHIWFTAHSAGAPYQSTTGTYLQLFDGEKHQVSVSWDATNGAVDFYIDGALVESFTGYQTGQTITGGGVLVFGQDQDSELGGWNTIDTFSGTLYDVRIFNDVRTVGEVAAGYDQTLPPAEPGMIANWTFGDLSTGGVITDAVSGNNLTEQHIGGGWSESTPELTLSIAEDAADLAVVGSVAAIDPDTGDTFLYSLQDNAGGRFDINSSTGEIFVLDSSLIDFESATSHNITVRVTDSGPLTYDEVFAISVTNADPIANADGSWFDETDGGDVFGGFADLANAHSLYLGATEQTIDLETLTAGDVLSNQFTGSQGVTFSNAGSGASQVYVEGSAWIEDITGYDGTYAADGSNIYLKMDNDLPGSPFTIDFDTPVAKVGALLGMGKEGANHSLTVSIYDAVGTLIDQQTLEAELWDPASPDQNYETFLGVKFDTAIISKIEILNASNVDYANALIFDQLSWSHTPDAGDSYVADTGLALVTGNVLDNDSDPSGGAISVSGFTQGANGSVAYNGDGTFTYTSVAGYTGTDSFDYTITDGNGGSDTATVSILVTNEAPTVESTIADQSLAEDFASYTIDLNAAFDDLETTDANLVYGVTGNTNINVSIASGIATITNTADWNGSETLTFTATDSGALSASQAVLFTVNAVNDAPVNTTPGGQTIDEDTVLVFNATNSNLISVGDVDSVSSPLQVTLTSTNGEMTLSQIDGLGFTAGTGTADTTMTFIGTIANVNAALDGLSFSPDTNFYGAADIQIQTSDLASEVIGNDTILGSSTTAGDYDKEQIGTQINIAENGTITSISAYLYVDKTEDIRFGLYTDSAGEPGVLLAESNSVSQVPGTNWYTINIPDTAVTAGDYWIAMDIGKEGAYFYDATGGQTRHSNYDPTGGLEATWTSTYASNTQSISVYANLTPDSATPLSDTDNVSITISSVNDAPVGTNDAYSVNEDTTLDVDWWNTNWTARQQLTFNNMAQTEDLVDFPVLVKLPLSFDYTKTQDNGEDLRFFDADGTALAHEIELWDESGSGHSYVWVKVPQIDGLSDADYVTMYYGNASAADGQAPESVWTNGYAGVWHLDDDPSLGAGAIDDSTANPLDGTASNMDGTNLVDGKIGGALAFDGSSEFIRVDSSASDKLAITGTEITIEAWVKRDGATGGWMVMVNRQLGATNLDSYVTATKFGANPDVYILNTDGGYVESSANAVPDASWKYLTAVQDGTDMRLYSNGLLVGSATGVGALTTDDNDVIFGGAENDGTSTITEFFKGMVDEIRISDVARSADWIAAQYASMEGAFVAFGDEEPAPATGGVMTNDSDIDGDAIAATLVSGPSNHALFTFNSDGTFSYTPTADFNGTDTFTYKVNDGEFDSSDVTVTITVNAVADIANDTGVSVVEDTATVIAVLANDNFEGTPVVTSTSTPTNGAVVINGDNTLTYTPDSNYTGADSFTYTVTSGGVTETATVNLTVTPVNDNPTVNATASDTGTEDTDQVYTHAQMLTLVGAADVDDVDANLSVVITNVINGSVVLTGGTGGAGTTFTFTPTGDFVGNMTFDYQVSDDESPTPASSAVGTVTVALAAENDAPTDLQVVTSTEGGTNLNNDGGNDVYFVADDGGTLLGGLTTVTIEASFSITTPGADLTPLFSYAQGSNDEELALFLKSDGRIWFAANSNGSPLQSTTGNYMQLFDGEQHHVAVSWDASTGAVDFYVDGVLVESFTGYQTGQSVTAGGELVFGQDQDSVLGGFRDFDVFKGTLYDIRVFDDIRTVGEIAAGYDQTLPPTESNMIANWTFGDLSTGGVITDAVSGNNLTLQHVVPGVGTWVASSPELTLSVAEDAADLAVVGSVVAIDPDTGDTFLYSLQDNAGGRFDIDTNSGEITVLDSSLIDFESATSHNITVRVTDSGLLTYDEVFTISVTEVNDNNPVITSNGGGATAALNVYENNLYVSTVTATDADLPAETLTYSIVGGDDELKFEIDGSTGVLSFLAPPDYENEADVGLNNVYDVIVQASDGTLSDTQAIAVTVDDVSDDGQYLDLFNADAYNNSDGSEAWTSNWIDLEDGSPINGNIKVSGGELRIIPNAVNDSIYRQVDLGSAATASYSFSFANNLTGDRTILVQVSGDGGSNYDTRAVMDATTNTGTGTLSFDITSYIASDTRIRFLVSAIGGGGPGGNLKIDNLEISYVADENTATVVNQSMTVAEGALNTVLTLSELQSTDTDTADSTLTYTVGNVTNGTLTINGSAWAASTNDTFTQQDIIDGNILYSHNDTNTTSDSFSYTVEDPAGNQLAGQTFSITVTAVDDDTATVVNQSMTVAEGVTNAALTLSDLESTDADTADASLIYTVGNVTNGTLTINGSAWAASTNDTFTQQDIIDGNILYSHNDTNTTSDGFSYTVEDPAGNQLTGQTFAITVTAVDDDTATAVNQSVTVSEGATNVALTLSELQSTDTDTADATLIYTVGNVGNGTLTINGSAWVSGTNDSFTQQDIIDGNILYSHNDTNTTSDSFSYTVEDPAGNQLTGQTFAITVTAVDDDTATVVNQSMTVAEGATNVALTLSELESTDTDTADSTLIYTVGNVTNGTLTINGSAWAASTNDTFTQQDIIDGNILYSHNDTNTTSDGFSYTVEDPAGNQLTGQTFAITVTAVDDDTATAVNQSMTVSEGATNVALTLSELQSTDTDTADATLIYTVGNVGNGTLTINGSAWVSGTNDSFTQQDIIDGNILYSHNDTNTTSDSFSYTVEDPAGNQLTGQTFSITVTAVDDDTATVVNQSMTVAEGDLNTVLTTADLQSTDTDTSDATLIYTVGNVGNATLTINGSAWAAATNDTFTQQDIIDGNILYSHNDTNTTSDSFSYTVEDPTGNQLTGQTFSITVTAVDDDTATVVNQSMTVAEGSSNTVLTLSELQSTDTDTADATLIYTVGNVGNGTLTINGSAWVASTNDTFTQQDIIDGNILYSHDDTNTTSDSFSYTVEDPAGNQLAGQTFSITVTAVDDDTATAVNQSMTVAEGDSNTVLTLAELQSTDTDTNDATLIYTVGNVGNGTLTINGSAWAASTNDSFTQQDIIDGNILYSHNDTNTTSDSFAYTVEDPTGNQLTGQTFSIAVTAVDDDTATVVNQSMTVAEGDLNTVLTAADLQSTDTDTNDATLIYTVGNVGNGTLTINGSAWAASTNDTFTQQDIIDGNILYSHNDTNTTSDSFAYTVEDPAGNQLTGQTFSITVTAVDDDTATVVNQSMTVAEGATNAALTLSDLESTDADTADATLIYTVGNVGNGTLTINGSVWTASTNDTFTQQDIIDGNILYSHNDTNTTSDSFAYTVEDPTGNQLTGQTFSITVTAVDDDTATVVNQSITAAEGSSNTVLTLGDLQSTDTDTADATLIYTVGNVTNGTLTINGSAWVASTNDSFTQQDIIDGNILYSHNDTNTTSDSFAYTVEDPAGNQLAGQTFSITVTAVDDDTATVVNQSITVAEGSSNTALTLGDLQSTDADTADSTLIYTVGNVTNGTLTINGSAWAASTNDSFTQQDIIDGNILYSHNDTNTTSDSFSYTVEDPAGNQLTGQTFAITVTAVDDDTATVVNQSITVAEGSSNTALTLGDLQSTDADTADSTLIYTVGNVTNGTLTINGSAWVASTNDSFTQQDIIDGNILYSHNDTNTTSDSFSYTVEDPAGNQLTGQTFAITVTAVDDDTATAVNQSMTVSEGATNVALTLSELQSTDTDTADATLIYTVGNVGNGTLTIKGSAWVSGTNDTFTQQDIIDGNILYSHDDSNTTSDSFSYTVEDPAGNTLAGQTFSITVTAVDDDTAAAVNQSMTVAEGALNTALTLSELQSTDTDTADSTLIYTVGNVTNGTLTINGSAWAASTNDTFTQQDIIDGNILYSHNDTNTTSDSFSYTVEDPAGNQLTGQTFSITVTAVDDDTATVVNQSMTVAEGALNTALTLSELQSTDTDTADSTLIYTVGNVTNGTLTINGSAWVASTNDSFTQQDIIDGNILYSHNDTNTTSDSFAYTVEDPAGNQLAGQTFSITVTAVDDDTATVVNQSITVAEGSSNTALTLGDLQYTDADTADSTLIYTVGNVTNGTLTINGSAWVASTNDSFTQQDIIDGNILYSHNDTNTTSDSFSYTVEDPAGNQLTGQTFSITVTAVDDDAATAVNQSMTVAEGDTNTVLTLADLESTDADTADATLIYTAGNVTNGTLTINGSAWAASTNDTFTQQDIIDGNILYSHNDTNTTSDSFAYTVEDPVGNQLAGQTFSITVTAVDDDTATVVNQSMTVAEGALNTALTLSELQSTDADTVDATLIYTAGNVTNGTLTINGSAWVSGTNDTFTQQDIIDGNILYSHNDANTTSDGFSYTVEDPAGNQLTGQAFAITVTAVDDDTATSVNQSMTVSEGATNVALTLSELQSTDTDTADATLVYTVGNVGNGTLTINGSAWVSGTNDTFTQQDIIDGNILYSHDDSNTTSDSFSYTVEDPAGNQLAGQAFGITVTAVDDDTATVVNQSMTVAEGSLNTALTLSELQSTDTDTADTTLIYTVGNVGNGTLTINGSAWVSGTNDTFTQQDIIDGNILYSHNDTNTTSDSFAYTVEDPVGNQLAGQTFSITVNAVNDAPIANAAASDTGTEDTDQVYTHAQMLTLIGAADVDDADADLSVAITNVINGSVVLTGGTGGAGTTFTFTPTGNFVGNMTFDYQVSDDDSPTPASSAVGTATVALAADNDAPTVNATASDTGTEDTDQVYTHAQMLTLIGSADVDDVDANLSVAITNVVNGSVVLSGGTGGSGTTFTFTPTPDFVGNMTFDYQVSDDEAPTPASSAVGTATVALSAVNDTPTVETTIPDQSLAEDFASYTIDLKAAFDDVETADTSLVYGVSGNTNINVSIASGIATITTTADWNGSETLTFTATDAGSLSASQAVVFSVSAVVDIANDTGVSVVEDTATVIAVLANDSFEGTPTVTATSTPTNGAVVINGDNTLTYTPDSNYTGADSFTYTVTSGGVTETATVNLTVTPVNDNPTVESTIADQSLAEDFASYTIDLKAAFDDVETADADLVYGVSGNTNINVSIASGIATITTTADWNGSETLTFTATDAGSLSASQAVVFAVSAVADVADDNAVSVVEDTATVIAVLANDSFEGTPTVTATSTPSNGAVVINGDNTLTYTPDSNYTGADSFTYTVTSGGVTETATVNLTVTPVNDNPTVESTIADQSLAEDFASYTIDLKAAFDDVETADADLVYGVSGNTNINVSIASGIAIITTTADWNGSETLTFTATDAGSLSASQAVVFAVSAVADVADDNAVSVVEDTATVIAVLANDSFEGTPTVTATSTPSNGAVVINGDNTLTYTPDSNYTGADSFTYTVTSGGVTETATVNLTVTPVNDTPTIGGVDTGAVTEDVDPDADTLLETGGAMTIVDADAGESSFVAGTVNGTYGDLVIDSAGTWSYSADNTQAAIQQLDAFETLTDTLTVTTADGSTHNVIITINGAEDASVVGGINTGTVTEDGTLTGSGILSITDVDTSDNPISFNDETATAGDNDFGTFEITGNSWTYTLNNANGAVQALDVSESLIDTHTFTASDGSTQVVTITINGAEDASVIGGAFTGTVTEDGMLTDNGLLTITDVDSNDIPVSFLDEATTPGDNGFGDFMLSSGTWTYTLNNTNPAVQALDTGETLTDTHAFTASDGSTQVVTITINGTDDLPVANNDSGIGFITDEDTTFTTGDVLGNDMPGDGPATVSTYDAVSANGGSISYNGDGTFTYTPAPDFTGSDTFTYTIADDDNDTSTATVTITVTAANDAPDAVGDSYTLLQNSSLEVTVNGLLANDSDVDGDSLTVTLVDGTANGTLTLNSDGTFSYVPDQGFVGDDSFTYLANDGVADSQLMTVLLQVASPVDDSTEDTTIVENDDPVTPPANDGTGDDPDDSTKTETTTENDDEVDPENLIDRSSGWEETTLDEVIDEIVLLDEDAIAELLEETLFEPVDNSVVEVTRADPVRTADRTPRVPYEPTSTLKYGDTYEYDAILNDHALWKEVEAMQAAMEEAFDAGDEQGDMFVKVSAGTSLTLTAGFVSYLLRAGTLLSSMLSFLPVWKGVDPLAVLVTKPREKDKKKNKDEDELENEQVSEDRQGDVDHFFNKGSE